MSILIKTMTSLPEHCYDCPCRNIESGYCQAAKGYKYSIDRPSWCPLIDENNAYYFTWIPISDGPPEEGKIVMASTEDGVVFPEARFKKEDGWEWAFESGWDYWAPLEGVIAWMPLPNPYKPESKND